MPKYVVSYDLLGADRTAYEVLAEKLKGAGAVPITESSWHLATTWSATRVKGFFQRFMPRGSLIAVNEVTANGNHASYGLSPKTLEWRKTHLMPR